MPMRLGLGGAHHLGQGMDGLDCPLTMGASMDLDLIDDDDEEDDDIDYVDNLLSHSNSHQDDNR